MAYIKGDRYQQTLFPQSAEDFVDEDDPVRVYDEYVDSLDVEKLGLKINENKEGAPSYYPLSMLKVLLYGYSYGIRSSRKLERALYHNITFIWLSGGIKPDHKTISLFRKRNRKVLKNIFKQCLELCIKLDVVKGNTLYVDGTKIRANAGMKHSYTKQQAHAKKLVLNKTINNMLNECDRIDKKEVKLGSLVKLDKQLKTAQKRKVAIEEALVILEQEEKEHACLNLVDPDCKIMDSRQGSHSSYNVQTVTDDEHGLIISYDVVNDGNDKHQLSSQYEQATTALGQEPEFFVADKGYSHIDECHKLSKKSAQVIIPDIQHTANKKQVQNFSASQFEYDENLDQYSCPKGHALTPRGSWDKNNRKAYKLKQPLLCLKCPHFGTCTSSKNGRVISRHRYQKERDAITAFFRSDQGQNLYTKRGQKAELPFGHIKRNLGVSSFLLRRFSGVKAEMSLFATCFNMRRLISLLGNQNLRQHLRTL